MALLLVEAVVLSHVGTQQCGPARRDLGRRVGAHGEGRGLLARDDEPTGCLIGAEVGEIMRRQIRGNVTFEVPHVFRRAVEEDLGAGVCRDRILEVVAELTEGLMGEDETEPVRTSLRQDVRDRTGQPEEVLALIEVEGGRGT